MPSATQVLIHSSQDPENIRQELLLSLRARAVNHKFHYDSAKQASQWLALHQACSPARTDPACAAAYEDSYRAVAKFCAGKKAVALVGLGCGGGQKDVRLLRRLRQPGRSLTYIPSDVSTAMALLAAKSASASVPGAVVRPFVCDLALTPDLGKWLDQLVPRTAFRIVTCLGLLPNFEPGVLMPRLRPALGRDGIALLSANLAPGPDYKEGVRRVLPLYDNALTRDWLLTFLLDLGVDPRAGEMRFVIENSPAASGLKRIAVYFDFRKPCRVHVDGTAVSFRPGASLRLFFSNRHTARHIQSLLERRRLCVAGQWGPASGEEGIYLCQRK